MGREATVTPEQVYDIADAIRADGGKPTLRNVRERLGAGSMGLLLSCCNSGRPVRIAKQPLIWSCRRRCSGLCWTS